MSKIQRKEYGAHREFYASKDGLKLFVAKIKAWFPHVKISIHELPETYRKWVANSVVFNNSKQVWLSFPSKRELSVFELSPTVKALYEQTAMGGKLQEKNDALMSAFKEREINTFKKGRK